MEANPTVERIIVYAGRHYGSVHRVVERYGRMIVAKHVASGDVITVHQWDTEPFTPSTCIPSSR
jgi:hypothetical protein